MSGRTSALRLTSGLGRLVTEQAQLSCARGTFVGLNSFAARLFSSPSRDDENVDFGFRQVPRDAKAGLVGQVFSSVASSYDIMNDLMSGGLHRLWKDRLVESLRPFPGQEHLDVAGGTGDVAFRVLRAVRAAEVEERLAAAAAGRTSTSGRPSGSASPAGGRSQRQPPPPPQSPPQQAQPGGAASTTAGTGAAASSSPSQAAAEAVRAGGAAAGSSGSAGGAGVAGGGSGPGGSATAAASPGGLVPGRVVVCDISAEMLREGQRKAAAASDLAGDTGLTFVEGNAECLSFPDASFDSYTIAFGIRNVTDRPAALREALRVLKPGGRFLCLEFSQVTQPGLRELYDAYSFAVIPRIGGLVANDAASYQYLVESIRKFPDQETFARLIEDAGFRAVTYENLTGGIVAIHSGFKL